MLRGLAAAAALVSTLVLAPSAAAAPGPVTITDAAGDSGEAGDITEVTAARQGASLTFRVVLANAPALTGEDELGVVFLDTDRNTGTGDELGAEYAVAFDATGGALLHWENGDFADTEAPVSVAYTGGVATVGVPFGAVDAPEAVLFYVVMLKGDPEAGGSSDAAPDGVPATVELPVIRFADARFKPAAPRAGALFAVTGVALEYTDGRKASASTVLCRATLGGKALKPVSRCRWRLPRNAKGKTLVVTVAIAHQGEAGTLRPYRLKVR